MERFAEQTGMGQIPEIVTYMEEYLAQEHCTDNFLYEKLKVNDNAVTRVTL